MRCAVLAAGPCVQSAVERSARTVHASTRGGRLRPGPSFLAKVDLLIGRWPGWEGGTHLCSRCSSSHHINPAAILAAAHCYLAGHDGLRQGRSYYVVVQRRSGASAAVELVWILPGGGPWPKLERVRVGGGWSCLQTSKDEEEAPAPARRCPASSVSPPNAAASANFLQKS